MIYPLLLGVALFGWTGAKLVNITIDDRFGDPSSGRSISYFPSEVWRDGTTCPDCTARPDADILFKKSWTDATFFPTEAPGLTNVKFANVTLSATIFFNGSAIFVNCVLAHTSKNLAGDSDLSFYIDGRLAGTFFKRAPGSPAYEYNVTVFSETNLPHGEHNLTIQNGHVNGIKSLILLDSIVYTQDDGQLTTSQISPSPSASVSNAAASAIGRNPSSIAPIVIAGVSGIIILTIVGMLLYSRSRRGSGRNRMGGTPEPTPLVYGHAHVNFPTRTSSSLSSYTISDMPPTYGEQSCSDYSTARRSPVDQKELPSLPAVGYLG